MLSIIFWAKRQMGRHPKRPKSIMNITKNASTKIKNCQMEQRDPFNTVRNEQK
jgi:hypothetical protein